MSNQLYKRDTNGDDNHMDELPPIKYSPFGIKNVFFIGICFILLLILITIVANMRTLAIEFMMLIILNMIAILIIIVIYFVQIWIRLKQNSVGTLPKKMNTLTRITLMTSIGLSMLTVLLFAFVMSPIDFGYGRFGTFVLILISMSTIVWIITLIVYACEIAIKFLWIKCFSVRQQLSHGCSSFFIGSFIVCPFLLSIMAVTTRSGLAGFGLGIAFSSSHALLIGGIVAAILYRRKAFKVICCILSTTGCVGVGLVLWYYLKDGFDTEITVTIPSERFPHNLTNDPSLNGNCSYLSMTYGSGIDRRMDYGIKASIITPTVDLSSIITISSFNKRVFKCDESALPLNGRVWHPVNANDDIHPRPIVILVHGNHLSTESSEIGYEYLGTMLASQGFIAVSVDMNFLNAAPTFSQIGYGKLSQMIKYDLDYHRGPELVARAIMILETLKQLRLWNEQLTNRFYKKLDLENIGLMGHSRGGEAIVIAHLFNKLKFLPDYPTNISFNNYNFGIKALFSISGTNDDYMPLGRSLQLRDVTMFAIHGIYDGDLMSFLFQAKLANLRFTPNTKDYKFKGSLYIHQANHGQFNTAWGRYDLISGVSQFMNLRPIMQIKEQQHICKLYMAAFMNLVLKNQTQYRILFEDYRSALAYLPYTNYISTFQDSNEIVIADFESYDITIGNIAGSRIEARNLLLWNSIYEKVYCSAMLLLQPIENAIGRYTIHLENPVLGTAIRFMVGRLPTGLVDYLTVLLLYENGEYDSFVVHVLPALGKKVFKMVALEYVTAMQTISLPLARPSIGLEFVINGTNAQFLIDNIVLAT
ncbi:unnamed protein product [Adineta ricciae]|uniref:Uncharacterized protein n=1 Tax=Adineta ricciae TaxID=249248 RepID=A0A815ZAP7_ADIRI|nr:unnamed protein product [Adineta ricciae]